jgi:hypothetical protein
VKKRAVVMAIALVTLVSCGRGTDGGTATGGSSRADEGGPEGFVEDLTRASLEQEITDRLTALIRDQQLPYVVSTQPSFSDVTEEDAAGTGLPAGTWLQIGLKLPTPDADHPPGQELFTYGPLELYAEAIRPYFGGMDFVVVYFLPWHNAGGSAFVIDPVEMRLYLDGGLSVKEFSKEITILAP